MSQQTRAQLKALKNNKVLSGGNQTTAQNLRDMFDGIIDSLVDILDDVNQNGGYLGIDLTGIVDITKIKSLSPTGSFLKDDGTWSAIVPPVTQITKDITSVTDIDLSAYSGIVIIELTSSNAAEDLISFSNDSNVTEVILRPNSFDLSIHDVTDQPGNFKLAAPVLTLIGNAGGFIHLQKRTRVNLGGTLFFQINYIDQYAT